MMGRGVASLGTWLKKKAEGSCIANNVTALTQYQASHGMSFSNCSAIIERVGGAEEEIEPFLGERREGLKKLEFWLGF